MAMDDEEYDDNSYRLMIAVGFAIGITVVAIILRLVARKIQKAPLFADDFVILAGAVGLDAGGRSCWC